MTRINLKGMALKMSEDQMKMVLGGSTRCCDHMGHTLYRKGGYEGREWSC